MNRVIIADTLPWTNSFRVGSHNYAECFLRRHYQVLYLPSYFHALTYFTERGRWKECRDRWKKGIYQVAPNLFTRSVFSYLPYRRKWMLDTPAVAKISLHATVPYLPFELQENGWSDVAVLWISNLQFFPLLKIIAAKKRIYRVPDSMMHFSSIPRTYGKVEEMVLGSFDAVITANRNSYEYFASKHGNVLYVPNGVDIERFEREGRRLTPPEEYLHDARPKVVYIGAFEEWFDWDLLRAVASQLRDVRFILIGRGNHLDNDCLELPNVDFLGEKSRDDLVPYLAYANAGIIPFKLTPLTHSINPLKLYEYSAAGLPTVATPMAEIMADGSPALIAGSAQEFVRKIALAITASLPREDLRAYAKNNTWEVRFKYIQERILN